MVPRIAVAWLVGLALAGALPADVGGVVAALALAGAVLVALVGRRWGTRTLLLLATMAAGLAVAPAPTVSAPPAGLARVTATVEDLPSTRSAVLTIIDGRFIGDGRAVPEGLRLRLLEPAPAGAQVRALLQLSLRPRFDNPTPHPPWPRPGAVDVLARQPEGARLRVLARSKPAELLAWTRRQLRDGLEATLSPQTAGLTHALVLGEREAVEPERTELVRDAGLAHVLAVSGLHVAIVAGLLVAFLRRLLCRWVVAPARWAAALGIPLALTHAFVAGGGGSALRAAITACIAWAVVAAGRRPRALPVLGAAAIVLSAADPAAALRPGFALSVLATTALVTMERGEDSALRMAVRASGRTMVATAPVVVWCFGALPLVGLVTNALVLPLAALVLVPLANLHTLVAAVAPPVALVTAAPLEAVSGVFIEVCAAAARVPLGQDLPPPSLAQGILFAALCALWLASTGRSWRWRATLLVTGLLSLGAAELRLRNVEKPEGLLRVTQLDVGQGDAALVDLPDGRAMLIDAGPPGVGLRVLSPLLRARRRSKIDVVVLTHPHPDHYGGLAELLGEVRVGEVWTNRQGERESPDGPATDLLRSLRAAGVPVRYPEALCGQQHRFGTAEVHLLAPCPGYDAGLDPNDNSLVVRLDHGERRMLFAGDAELLQERGLVAAAPGPGPAALRADVLKVPHHGSRTSSTRDFLDAVRPRWALVSCGRHNTFGHPHDEALERLSSVAATELRTDRDGGIVLTSDGQRLWVEPFRAFGD